MSQKNKIALWINSGFILLFMVIICPSNYKGYIIGFLGIILIINYFKFVKKINTKYLIWFTLPYLGLILSLTETANLSFGMSYVFETQLSLFLLPFLLSLIDKKTFKRVLKNKHLFFTSYIVSVFLYTVIPFVYWFVKSGYTWRKMVIHYISFIEKIGKWNIHPIYLSTYIAIAILLSVYLYSTRTKIQKLVLMVVNLVLLFFLFIMARKGPILALLVSFFILVNFMFNKRKRMVLNMTLLIFIMSLFLIPKTRTRFKELLTENSKQQNLKTSTGIRYSIYHSAFDLFLEAPIGGYGVGDHLDVLIQRYKDQDKAYLVNHKMSAHNQYLSFLLMGGILLLGLYLIMLFYVFKIAYKTNNYLLISILILYSIVMLTENVLNREDGVLLFSILISFLGLESFYQLKQNEK